VNLFAFLQCGHDGSACPVAQIGVQCQGWELELEMGFTAPVKRWGDTGENTSDIFQLCCNCRILETFCEGFF